MSEANPKVQDCEKVGMEIDIQGSSAYLGNVKLWLSMNLARNKVQICSSGWPFLERVHQWKSAKKEGMVNKTECHGDAN